MDITRNDSYKEAKACFIDDVVPGKSKVIEDLDSLKDEIQEEEHTQKIWNILYSLCGFIGGTLTFAALAFAPLATVGFALGTTSTAASLLHISVKIQMINKRLTYAERSLESFKDVCEDMKHQLITLNRDLIEQLETNQEIDLCDAKKYKSKHDKIAVVIKKIEKLLQHPSLSDDNILNKVKKFGKSVDGVISGTAKAAKVSTKALGKMAAASIIVNLTSLILESDNLYNLEKGRLCDEADKIKNIIDKIENLEKELMKVFQ